MRPISIEFQAFGPYEGREFVDFEKLASGGLFLICGETGSGKTMILDAMTFALYGKSTGSTRDDFLAMRSTGAPAESDTYVRFDFENNHIHYRFERRLEKKRVNLSEQYSLLKMNEEGIFEPMLENPKKKDLDNAAEEIIGLDYDQFRQVIILPQGQFEKFLVSNSDEKEKILLNIFGEDKWQRIVEILYENAEERLRLLKKRKDDAVTRLKEDGCESLEELAVLIDERELEIKEKENLFEKENYQQKKAGLQKELLLIGRFEDYHKACRKHEILLNQKEKYEELGNAYKEAQRAEKMRDPIEKLNLAKAQLAKRTNEKENAFLEAEKAENKNKEISEKLKKHMLLKLENEERIRRVIELENAREAYLNAERKEAEVRKCQSVLAKAESAEASAGERLLACTEKVLTMKKSYEALGEEYRSLLEAYLKGISAELAAKLSEGKPCPVCGSTTHPDKAKCREGAVDKESVDRKQKEERRAHEDMEAALSERDKAQKELDEAKAFTTEAGMLLTKAQTALEAVTESMIAGIGSLSELDRAADETKNMIDAYERETQRLEEMQKDSAEKSSRARALLTNADTEEKLAIEAKDASCAVLEKSLAQSGFESVSEACNALWDADRLEQAQRRLSEYSSDVKAAGEALLAYEEELRDTKEPDRDECESRLNEIDAAEKMYTKEISVLKSIYDRLKNKYESVKAESEYILSESKEAEEDFAFAKCLRGDTGTGLQRYVLGIMFSTVIVAANRMLEMVHDGRYRLYRSDERVKGSNKRGLELKVYDRYSTLPEGRFVNTLSGGEKFLVSLALSIGMSTIAGKSGIKIEALFIDEGFGSLDEDSVEDAMNILNCIRESNSLIGIISHVRLLQDRISNKLRVSKKDGRSHIELTVG